MTLRHLATLSLLSVIWGASFLFIKVQLDAGIAPLGVASLRTLLGAAVLLPLTLGALRDGAPARRSIALLAVVGLANFAIPWTLIAIAEHHISTGMASIANSTAPLWAGVLAVAFLGDEPLTRQKTAGLLIGFAGIILLAGPASLAGLTGEALGVSLVLASTLCYAVAAVVIRRTFGGLAPSLLAFGQVSAAAAALLPLAASSGAFTGVDWQPRILAAALILGGLGSGAAVILYMGLIQQIGAVRATLVTYLIPPWGVFFGWVFLDERLDWNVLAGLVTILAGVLTVQGVLRLPRTREALPAEGPAALGK